VLGKRYYAHRLAWLYEYGEFPEKIIDHIDGNRTNNSIHNLRDVSQALNSQNQKEARIDNGTGYLGVTFDKRPRTAKYRARIGITGCAKRICLGYFETPELAHLAYLDAKRKLHPGNML
jgi:hypothetical protein